MTTSALLDALLAHYDSVSSSDADNAGRRTTLLQFAQEVFDEAWLYREWTWRHTTGTITVLASTNSIVLPTDFHSMGQNGRVFESGTTKRYFEAPYQWLEDRLAGTTNNSNEQAFSVAGFDSTTGRRLFRIAFTPGSNLSFDLRYLNVPPTLVDTTGSTNKLDALPAEYHNTVILPGAVAKLKEREGDSRHWYDRYLLGLGRMAAYERPNKTFIQRMGRSVPGQW